MGQPMTYEAVVVALAERPAWALVNGRLVREHTFGSWAAAHAAIASIAALAERLDHHPDWQQRGGTLRIELMTHRPRGISQLDFDLATAIDAVLPEEPTCSA